VEIDYPDDQERWAQFVDQEVGRWKLAQPTTADIPAFVKHH
jgi:hypothetical protein